MAVTFERNGSIAVTGPHYRKLLKAAQKRDTSTLHIMTAILSVVLEDDIVDAVLDDQETY